MMQQQTAIQFRWDELDTDHPMDMITRRRVIGRQAMISHVRLEKGCIVPSHAHENEQFVCVLSGRLRFGLGDPDGPDHEQVEIAAGEGLLLPSNVPHSAEAIEETIVLDIFAPPSEKTGIDSD